MLPGQESSVPEKQELHQSSWVERHPQGVGAGCQDSGDALGLPGTLTDTCAPRRMHHILWPSSLKDCRAHSWTRSSFEGLGRWLHMEGAVRPGLGVGSSRGRGSLRRGLRGSGTNSEGLGRQRRGGGCVAGRGNPTAQALEHRVPGHSPGFGLPLGQAEPGKAHDS